MYVGRRRDGRLQWMLDRDRGSDKLSDEDVRRHRVPGDYPSYSELERLLALYVATGEGKGAYIAAKVAEEADSTSEARLHARRTRYSRPGRYSRSSSGSDYDDYRPRPPHRPPGGQPPAAPAMPQPPLEVHVPMDGPQVGPADYVAVEPEHIQVIHPDHQANVHIDLENDDYWEEPEYVDLPPEEDDHRLSNPHRRSRASRAYHAQRTESRRQSLHHRTHSYERHRRRPGDVPVIIPVQPGQRPGRADQLNSERRQAAEDRRHAEERQYAERRQYFGRRPGRRLEEGLRGGGFNVNTPTKTTGLGAGVLPPGSYGTRSKAIVSVLISKTGADER